MIYLVVKSRMDKNNCLKTSLPANSPQAEAGMLHTQKEMAPF